MLYIIHASHPPTLLAPFSGPVTVPIVPSLLSLLSQTQTQFSSTTPCRCGFASYTFPLRHALVGGRCHLGSRTRRLGSPGAVSALAAVPSAASRWQWCRTQAASGAAAAAAACRWFQLSSQPAAVLWCRSRQRMLSCTLSSACWRARLALCRSLPSKNDLTWGQGRR